MDNSISGDFDLQLFLKKLTTEPGVYRMLDTQGKVLYVGKASNLKKRVSSYFLKQNSGAKTRSLVNQIASIEISITRSETEALLLESNLIKTLRPKYNVLMRDDKSYPYIYISRHAEFPRIELMRSKKKPRQGEFYGPYPNVIAVRETLNTLQKIFKIRNCTDTYFKSRSRPCLQYQIKRCTAPCVGYISKEGYQDQISHARQLLQGKSQEIILDLEERMAKAASAMAFEEAAFLRDQIKHLRVVQEKQGMVQIHGDADVIALVARPGFACVQCVTVREGQVLASQAFFPSVPVKSMVEADENDDTLWQTTLEAFIGHYYLDEPQRIPALIVVNHPLPDRQILEDALSLRRGSRTKIMINPRGIKARWLDFAQNNLKQTVFEFETHHSTLARRFQALTDWLKMEKPIARMECFDISHTSGQETVASCVVFDENGPAKNYYRRYNIHGITPGDDYAAMEQALKRRFKGTTGEQILPDLLIIDGGKGQVAVASRVLDALAIQGVTLMGVAKGPERKAGWERLILAQDKEERTLPEDSLALHLIQQIRDEAHRFAITAHRKKRQKLGMGSTLEAIEGVGPKRRQALLRRFGGVRELAKASVEEIAKVPGISAALAQLIYDSLQ